MSQLVGLAAGMHAWVSGCIAYEAMMRYVSPSDGEKTSCPVSVTLFVISARELLEYVTVVIIGPSEYIPVTFGDGRVVTCKSFAATQETRYPAPNPGIVPLKVVPAEMVVFTVDWKHN